MEEAEYILGTDDDETRRLRFQHIVWRERTYALWAQAGFGAGQDVADLGCGPGFTTLDLSTVVAPGRLIACDQSERFLAQLTAECERRGLDHVETRCGPIEELDLPAGSLDGAYARWLLSWLPEPGAALDRVLHALRPGGVIALQEYLDWGAMKILPRSRVFDRAVAACMQGWAESDGEIDVVDLLPGLAADRGLRLELFRPQARLGAVGSLEWRWLTDFFLGYLPKLVERGLYGADELETFRAEWEERTAEGGSWCTTPTLADVVLRKP